MNLDREMPEHPTFTEWVGIYLLFTVGALVGIGHAVLFLDWIGMAVLIPIYLIVGSLQPIRDIWGLRSAGLGLKDWRALYVGVAARWTPKNQKKVRSLLLSLHRQYLNSGGSAGPPGFTPDEATVDFVKAVLVRQQIVNRISLDKSIKRYWESCTTG